MKSEPLKLWAQDAEDIQIISAVLQDAIAPVCDMLYRPSEKNFVMVVHRFCWDCPRESGRKLDEPSFERVCCALDIRGVEAVRLHGFSQEEQGAMLDLLTINLEKDSLQLIFAGEARLKLKLSNWNLRLEDFGEPWPTTYLPSHVT